MVSFTFSSVSSRAVASSSLLGGLSNSCSSLEKALFILFKEPTWLRGNLTILDCSANACKIDCLIHHTA
jgi:hypothetical protein